MLMPIVDAYSLNFKNFKNGDYMLICVLFYVTKLFFEKVSHLYFYSTRQLNETWIYSYLKKHKYIHINQYHKNT